MEQLLPTEEAISGVPIRSSSRPALDGEGTFAAGQFNRRTKERIRDPVTSVIHPHKEARQQPDSLVLGGFTITISSLRAPVATEYRDRGPQAHQPTGSPFIAAEIPMGVALTVAMVSNRRRLPP